MKYTWDARLQCFTVELPMEKLKLYPEQVVHAYKVCPSMLVQGRTLEEWFTPERHCEPAYAAALEAEYARIMLEGVVWLPATIIVAYVIDNDVTGYGYGTKPHASIASLKAIDGMIARVLAGK